MSEILTDFLQFTEAGLYCRYGDFYIDPVLPVANALISHAHGDHARAGNAMVFCTAPTEAIMRCRYGKKAARSFTTVSFQQSFRLKDVEISFIAAGHILGSAQILMLHRGIRYLYTGDYKVQPDSTCEPLQYAQADVLITESTFAKPTIAHPDPVGEIRKLSGTPFNILLGTYGLGKAQRLTDLINRHCPEKTVLLHYSILPIHKIYEQFGVTHLRYQAYDRKIMKKNDKGFIYLVPPLTFNSYFRAPNLIKAFASGWAYLQQRNDISLYISDHVDWQDILSYVEKVRPREIWTLHGDGNELMTYYQDRLIVRILN